MFRNSAEIYGFISMFCGLSCFSGPIVIKFVIGNSNDIYTFQQVFLIGSLMQILCFVLCLFFQEEKFEYEELIDE